MTIILCDLGGRPMKKHVLCLILLLSLCVPTAAALEGDPARAGDLLASYGVVQGTPEGYDLDSLCTRTQALVILSRLGNFPAAPTTYHDVPAWAGEAVGALEAQGLLKGIYDGSRLHSNEYINAEEWSALLLRLCGVETQKEGAYRYARRLGLISREYSSPLKRGELFEMTCDALSYAYDGATLAQHMGKEPMGKRLTAREVADHCTASVMALRFYPSQQAYERGNSWTDASGFFLTADGIAVTNYHAMEKAEVGVAVLATGEEFPVEGVLWSSKEADLAVLRISRTSVDRSVTTPAFAAVTMAGSETVRPGDRVYAIGNALGLGLSVSEGIVSAVDRGCSVTNIPCFISTADISAGSSGGALFNELGHAVAVTTGAFPEGNGMYINIPLDKLIATDFTHVKATALKSLSK